MIVQKRFLAYICGYLKVEGQPALNLLESNATELWLMHFSGARRAWDRSVQRVLLRPCRQDCLLHLTCPHTFLPCLSDATSTCNHLAEPTNVHTNPHFLQVSVLPVSRDLFLSGSSYSPWYCSKDTLTTITISATVAFPAAESLVLYAVASTWASPQLVGQRFIVSQAFNLQVG